MGKKNYCIIVTIFLTNFLGYIIIFLYNILLSKLTTYIIGKKIKRVLNT